MEFKPELLSPAGSLKVLKAAANTGADAVYFGLTSFNARNGAKNFTYEEAGNGISYLKNRGKKAYITLNTLVKDIELSAFKEEIKNIAKLGPDALIVQDLGAVNLIKQTAPDMEIHASTQMAVHNLEGVEFLYKNGIKRVVLAREVSLDEIKYIKENTECEIEIFIHGALCVCYSGQCYMSSFIGERSGNRGKCAQPCRLNYDLMGKKGTLLSLKDMSSVNYIDRIKSMKIDSLKIEGRLKNEYYVATVTDTYRRLLDGDKLNKEDIDLLYNIFSRGGYTDYFEDYKNKKMFCYNKNENPYNIYEKKAEEKYKNIITENIRNDESKVPLNFEINLFEGTLPSVRAFAEGKEVFYEGEEVLGEAKNAPATEEKIKESISKLNDTPFYANEIKVNLGKNVFVPVKTVNDLRREAVNLLIKKEEIKTYDPVIKKGKRPFKKSGYIVKANLQSQLSWADANSEIKYVIANYNLVLKNKDFLDKEKTVIMLPRIISKDETEKIVSRLTKLRDEGFKYGLVSNISHFEFLKDFKLIADSYLNILNSYSQEFLKQNNVFMVGASAELNLKDIKTLCEDMPVFAMGYGYNEVMITRNCIKKSVLNECVKGPVELIDRKGEKFKVDCREDCRNIILNSHPIVMSDKVYDMNNSGIDYIMLSFYGENASACQKIFDMYKSGENTFEKFTRGHFYRGVL